VFYETNDPDSLTDALYLKESTLKFAFFEDISVENLEF
jgi:hypothetical protein